MALFAAADILCSAASSADPLRVLRAVRFATRFGFALEPSLAEAAASEQVRIQFDGAADWPLCFSSRCFISFFILHTLSFLFRLFYVHIHFFFVALVTSGEPGVAQTLLLLQLQERAPQHTLHVHAHDLAVHTLFTRCCCRPPHWPAQPCTAGGRPCASRRRR